MNKHFLLTALLLLSGLFLYSTPPAFSQPDLIVSSVTHTPRYPTTNHFVTFTVTVKNQGDQPSNSCSLDVTLTGPKNDDYAFTVPALNPGISWQAQFTQKLNPKGTYTVTATADFTNLVSESNETNNTKIIYVTCTTPNTRDLVVEVLTWTPQNPSETDTITITAGVKNIGPTLAGASTLELQVGTETNPPTYSIPALDTEEIYEIQRQIILPADSYQITATADINNNVGEADETNNVTVETITVSALPKPDLIVSSLTHSPVDPTITDTITITTIVQNMGIADSTTSTLSIDVTGDASPTTYSIPILTPTQSRQIQRIFNPVSGGFFVVTAISDADNDNLETNEDNNTTTDSFTVTGPDLIISSLTHAPLDPTISDTVTITAIVRNDGDGNAGASTLRIALPGESSPPAYAVPALIPSQTHQVQRLVNFTAPGDYLATATADINNAVTETDETNNPSTHNIHVIGPDIIVQSLTHSPISPTITDTVTITAIVRNSGDGASGVSTLEIDVEGEPVPATYSIPSLDPSETYQVQRQVSLTSPGVYQVIATADLDDDITETNETNNQRTDNIIVTAPDLIISSLGHLPIDPKNIDTITITAIVENVGGASAGPSTLEIDVDGNAVTYVVPSLNAMETRQVQRQLVLNTPGIHDVTATADLNHAVTESNENNNTTTDTITVIEAADLIISTLIHSPSYPTITDAITITVIVRNRGGITAEASTLEIDVDGEATPATYAVPSLAPSQTHQVQRQVSYATPGTRQVTATADLNENIAESIENNNEASDSITVTAPDLIVSSLIHAPANPTISDTIAITAIVQNTGDAEATTSTLKIDVDGHDVDYIIPPLAPEQSIQIERWTLLAAGIYTVTAAADANNDVEESNEENNTAEDSIMVRNLPDLVVSGLEYIPDIAVTHEDVVIKTEVRNAGLASATTSTLSLLVGDELIPVIYEIPPLDAGTTFTVERHISFDTAGYYPVTATADEDDEIWETNETNNDAGIIIEVYEWDFNTLKNYLLKRIEITEFQKRLYDVNGDGKLDAGDLVLLIIKTGLSKNE